MIKHAIAWLKPFYPTIKALEVLGVIAALIAFSYDFIVEKPRDRAIANATMYAQMAALDVNEVTDRQAIKAIALNLIQEGIPLEGVEIPHLSFYDRDLEKPTLLRSHLPAVKLERVDVHSLNSKMTTFDGGEFRLVNFIEGQAIGTEGVHFFLSAFYVYPEVRVEKLGSFEERRINPPFDKERSFQRALKTLRKVIKGGVAGGNFVASEFTSFNFFSVDLTEAEFEGSTFRKSVIGHSILDRTKFIGKRYPSPGDWDLTITDSLLINADFSALQMEEMRQISFKHCFFENVKFPEGYTLPEGAGVVIQ